MQEKRKFRTRAVFLIVVWTLLLVLSLSLFSILWSSYANNPQGQTISSLSWAGYTTTQNSANSQYEVIAINASWIIPKVNTSASDGYSSAWIGIGGQSDKTLIQVGTEHDAVNGQENCFAWYELLPSIAVRLNDITVSPGDTMIASINIVNSDTNEWSIQISDSTTGQVFSRNFVYNSTRSSGEWILERPTINKQITTLADFGNVTFTNCNANVNNVTGPVGKFSFSKIQMENSQNEELTSVSALTDGESSFTVNYLPGK
ncbi:MAG: G1 family glutamic endopeptidase [Candidatus Bathyarchaeia archaeon]